MFGIKNYTPHFYKHDEDLFHNTIEILNSVLGQTILKVFWVWDIRDNTWFDDCPVVIELTDGYLSLCASKLSEFAIGWNDILLTEKIDWYGMDFDLEWREYNDFQSFNVLNKVILGIKVISYQMGLHNSDLQNTNDCIDDKGLLNGVALQYDAGFLAITNGLDKTNIELFEKDLPKYIISKYSV